MKTLMDAGMNQNAPIQPNQLAGGVASAVVPSPVMPARSSSGSLERAFLPALEKLSRTRHGAADLETIAMALKRAEEISPGLCDHLVTELLTTLVHPQQTNIELRKAIDRLTT